VSDELRAKGSGSESTSGGTEQKTEEDRPRIITAEGGKGTKSV
jgi:hypothetical protein